MSHFLQLSRRGLIVVFRGAFSVVLWTIWLALVALIAVQLWWVLARELSVPDFLLRSLEARLAQSQLHATFGHTAFDPSGHILVEDVKLFSPTFQEPLLTARTVYVRLDPWSLLAGRFDPQEVNATGISLFVPAMLSTSGKLETLASDIAATVVPGSNLIELRQFTAHIGTLDITAHGAFRVSASASKPNGPLPIADLIAHEYPRFSRRVADYLIYLKDLDQPRLDLLFEPSEAQTAFVTAALSVREVELTQPVALQSHQLIVHSRFPLSGKISQTSQLEVEADNLRFGTVATAGKLNALIVGVFRPDLRTFTTTDVQLSVAWIESRGIRVQPADVQLTEVGPTLRGTISAGLGGEPIVVSGAVNLTEKTAQVNVSAHISSAVLQPASDLAHRDLNQLFALNSPPLIQADVQVGPDWKLLSVEGRLLAEHLVAHEVPLEFVSAHLLWRGSEFNATDVVLRTQGNSARGIYTMDTGTRDYRILLTGELLPTDINGWFGPWWPSFFSHFKFGDPRPIADVDVQGRWGDAKKSLQFIQVHAPGTSIYGVAFDDVRTSLFIRPGFYDALDLRATQGKGAIRGEFTYIVTPGTGTMKTLDFVSHSTIDPLEGARIFGAEGTAILEPFRFETPPKLDLRGHLDGPASPQGRHETVAITAVSIGPFRLFDFPLNNVSFQAELHDDDLSVHDVQMTFAEGAVSGHARLWGRGENKRLSFDVALTTADLGRAVQDVEGFAARRKPQPPGSANKSTVFEKRGVKLSATASGEGRYDDVFSFQGKGETELEAADLGEVRLLGAMSDLFNFTAIHFNNLTSSFRINGPILDFPDMRLTGANSSVNAYGTYDLDHKKLDFNAKLFPFAESKFIPQVIIGAVLSPLSQILEVRLTGSLDNPSWAFVRGPTNFLRALGGSPRAKTSVAMVPAISPSAPLRTNRELSQYIKRSVPQN